MVCEQLGVDYVCKVLVAFSIEHVLSHDVQETMCKKLLLCCICKVLVQ